MWLNRLMKYNHRRNTLNMNHSFNISAAAGPFYGFPSCWTTKVFILCDSVLCDQSIRKDRTFTHACSDVVESKALQEIDVTVEPRENRVGLEHQPFDPLLAQDDVHGDCTLQIARIGHL